MASTMSAVLLQNADILTASRDALRSSLINTVNWT